MGDEKMPCICGRRNPELWYSFGVYTIKCGVCGKEVYGRSQFGVINNWNHMVRKGKINERNQEESSVDGDSGGIG